MSMTPASGNAAVVSPTTMRAAPLGAALGKAMLSSRARRLIVSSWRRARSRRAALAPGSDSGTLAATGTFISVRTERISLIEAHDPADLLVDRLVGEPRTAPAIR